MGSSSPSELTLDCSYSLKACAKKTIDRVIAEGLRSHIASDQISNLDNLVNGVKDEMKKIDAFKRELPICMYLLSEMIATAIEEKSESKKSNAEPVLEFIPLKKSCSDEKDDKVEVGKETNISSGDKMNWMSSVQLWNSDHHNNPDTDFSNNKLTLNLSNEKKRKEEEVDRPAIDNIFRTGKIRTVGRAFVPFKECTNFPVMTVGKEDKDALAVPGLSLCTPEIKNSMEAINSIGFIPKSSCTRSGSSSAANVQSSFKAGQQHSARKQRRCWSPELHRQFVQALQSLGGAQVATPKQIRELMQIDGLTNDEVKSHLQKFRLHTRKATTKSVCLWMPQELCGESLKPTNSQSGSPEGPLHLAGSSRVDSEGYGSEYEDDERSESPHQLSGRDL